MEPALPALDVLEACDAGRILATPTVRGALHAANGFWATAYPLDAQERANALTMAEQALKLSAMSWSGQ